MHEIYSKLQEFISLSAEFFTIAWNQPHAKTVLLVILGLVVLLFAVRKIRKTYAPIKLFNNSAGYVTVTPKALNELVQSVCYSMGSLNKPDVKIHTRRGRLYMQVSLKLEMGQKLSEVSASIQDELMNAAREQLGVEKLGRIDVKIKGFRGVLRKSQLAVKVPEEKPADQGEVNDPFAPNNT